MDIICANEAASNPLGGRLYSKECTFIKEKLSLTDRGAWLAWSSPQKSCAEEYLGSTVGDMRSLRQIRGNKNVQASQTGPIMSEGCQGRD